MRVRVLLFAHMAELAGKRELVLDVDDGASAADALDEVARRLPPLMPYRAAVAVAVNEQFVSRDRCLHEGDVVAIIPPVSGG